VTNKWILWFQTDSGEITMNLMLAGTKIATTIFVLLWALISSAQTFPNPATFLVGADGYGAAPYSVALGDFNGDGKAQLAVALQCKYYVWCITFGGLVNVLGGAVYDAGGSYSHFVTQGDFNGDGIPDLVLINQYSCETCSDTSVSVLLGSGDGTFQTAKSYATGIANTFSLAVADFDSDGKQDLALAAGSTIQLVLGNGDGTFRAGQIFSLGNLNSISIAAGDFNSDGKSDLVIAGGSAAGVSVLLGNGNGTFQPAQTYSSGGSAQLVEIGDFDNDGISDLAALNGSSIGVLLGNGEGTFKAPQVNASTGSAMALGDLNGDGKLDLAVVSGSITVLLGNGDGTFQAGQSYNAGGIFGGWPSPAWVAIGDFDGDAKPDLAVGVDYMNNTDPQISYSTDSVSILTGKGDGTFSGKILPGLGSSTSVADFNGDGNLDLASANGSTINLLEGYGDGTFQVPLSIQLSGWSANWIVAGDFNGDKNADLAAAGGSTMGVLLANGDGTFQSVQTYSLGATMATFIGVADFNGDSKLDLAVSTDSSTNVSVFLGNGDGTFGSAQVYATAGQGDFPMGVGDFNGDAKPDLVFANVNSTIALIRGNGDGTFQPPIISDLSSAFAPASLAAGDFNGDSIADVVVALRNDANYNSWEVMEGSLDGTFVLGANSSNFLGAVAEGAAARDFNGDGLADAIITYDVGIAFSTSDGSYYNVSGAVNAIGDFNNDGKPDLVIGATVLINAAVGVPEVTLSPTSLNFPTQLVFTTSRPQTVTVTNSGGGILNVTSITATGPFSQTNTCNTPLAPGSSCTITVAFSPTTKGILSGDVSITDNAPGSPQTVKLTGTGTYVKLLPTSLKFGNQPVGTKSLPKKVTLTNKGSVAVRITSIAITGVNAADFAETNNCGRRVAPGASCSIKATFTPSVKGIRAADISVSDNGGGSPQKVHLSGTGT
jgi:hypothetical protein